MKFTGSIESLIQGVSQQVPAARRAGQHSAQVNMIPDPQRGVSRRHGTIWKAEKDLGLSVAQQANNEADLLSWKTFRYSYAGVDYSIIYRSGAKASGATLPLLWVYDETNHAFLTLTTHGSDTLYSTLESGGISAITAIGKYVFMAGNTIVPTSSTSNLWSATANLNQSVVWVRGGAYARTYKVTVVDAVAASTSFEYTTPASQYPGHLDVTQVSPFQRKTKSGSSVQPDYKKFAQSAAYPWTGSLPNPTITLTHTPVTTKPFHIQAYISYGPYWDSGSETLTLVVGTDYTLSGTTVTLKTDSVNFQRLLAIRGLPYWTENWGGTLTLSYTYDLLSTSSQDNFATVTTAEAVYPVASEGGAYSTAHLIYGDFAPSALTVSTDLAPMTNVHPALPATASEYHWDGRNGTIIFHKSLADTGIVRAEYTHYDVEANPGYAQQIAFLTNDYNSKVTKWIASAAAAIQPAAIAGRLAEAATAAGITCSVVGSSVVFDTAEQIRSITVNDGGDGTLIRATCNEVGSVDQLTDMHYVGKIVKINPGGAADPFYMKAAAKDPTVTSGVVEVVWTEGCGVQYTITQALFYGQVKSGVFYVASTKAYLDSLTGESAPGWEISKVGDAGTNPLPYFIGRKISYLGVFQDRLQIGSGAVISSSRVSDYLNMFRTSVVTALSDDYVQMLSQAADDDTIKYGTFYDRNLVLFGKRQYQLSGSTPLTPTSAVLPVLSTHAGADDAQPIAAGSLIFYAKRGAGFSSVEQLQLGQTAESPESYPASSALNNYLTGSPVELTWNSKPQMLLLRTTGAPRSYFVMHYIDQPGQRVMEAWHRWDYDAKIGVIGGTSVIRDGILMFTLRHAHSKVWAVCDLQPTDGALSPKPYFDSQRLYSSLSTGSLQTSNTDGWKVAFDDSSEWRLLGGRLEDAAQVLLDYPSATNLMVGFPFTSQFEPTNPYNKDQNGRAITSGRTTITSFLVSFDSSVGWIADVITKRGTESTTFNGRIFGDPNNQIGREPVSTGDQSVIVGYEVKEYRLVFNSRTWLPLNITVLQYVGQHFQRSPRR